MGDLRIETEGNSNSVEISRLDLEDLKKLVKQSGFEVMTDSSYFLDGEHQYDPDRTFRIAYTTVDEPSILYENGATVCSLFLAFDNNGNAGLVHQPGVEPLNDGSIRRSQLELDKLEQLIENTIELTESETRQALITGRTLLDKNIAEDIDNIVEKLDCRVYALEDSENNSATFGDEKGITGMVFIPRYLSEDNTNHIIYIDLDHAADEQRALEKFLKLI